MNEEEIKLLWKSDEPASKTKEEIIDMLEEKRHPVLKGIKKQIIIELIGWTAFLLCYYTMFDGDRKPWFINLALIAAVLIPFTHNLYGYKLTKNAVDNSSILTSVTKHVKQLRIYATWSVISRVVFSSGLVLFFSYHISFSTSKRYLLAGLVMLLIISQILVLYQIWQKRIKRFEHITKEMSRFE